VFSEAGPFVYRESLRASLAVHTAGTQRRRNHLAVGAHLTGQPVVHLLAALAEPALDNAVERLPPRSDRDDRSLPASQPKHGRFDGRGGLERFGGHDPGDPSRQGSQVVRDLLSHGRAVRALAMLGICGTLAVTA